MLTQNMGYVLRQWRMSPGFAVTAILTLALGIGANVAIFTLVNNILLRPLPFAKPQQLVWIAPPPAKCGFSCATFSADAYDEFRVQSKSYQDVTGYFAFSSADNLRLTGHGAPQPATGVSVIGNFFDVLGVPARLGRTFASEETRSGARAVVVLSNPFWRRQFASDPQIVGKAIDLNGQPTTVIGVMPESFDFGAVFSPGERVDMITPLILDDARGWGNIVTFIGRLKPDVSLAQAGADARLVAPNLYWNVKYPGTRGSYKSGMVPQPLKEYVSGRLRRPLTVLWAAVGMILLIACVNLSNLLLARSTARGREFALRSALGASRGRILGLLMLESLALAAAGSVLGLGIASAIVAALARQGAVALPLLGSLRIDAASVGWTVVVAGASTLLFGLLPALKLARGNMQSALKDGGHSASQGRGTERLRSALVISEVALACTLLVGAGMLLRSFMHVLDIDLGFEPDRAAAIKVDYDDGAPTDEASALKRGAIFQQVISRVVAIPGVQSAGIVDYLPLEQNRSWSAPIPKGSTYRPGELPFPLVYVVTPGYMHSMGMRLHGRDFSWEDGPKAEQVIAINETAARFLWPHEDAVGKIVTMGKTEVRVVGVVEDVHQSSVENEPGWQMYFPAMQQNPNDAQLVVRSTLPATTLSASVMHVLRELNPRQPSVEFRPVRQLVDHAVSPRRFFMLLVATFSGLGLLLAALGIYGVISYSVARRTQEIGIRMALGATRARVVSMVIGGALTNTLAGVLIGVPVSLLASRLIADQLYGMRGIDPVSIGGAVAALGVCAGLAGWIPAQRAASVEPIKAFRQG